MFTSSPLNSIKMALLRILFIAEGQLGDLLLLTPALRAAKELSPRSLISVLVLERRSGDTSKPNPFQDLIATAAERESSVLSTNKNVDELLVLNRRALRSLHGLARVKAELSIVRALRKKKFDAVVCTFPEDRFAAWAFASGAAIRIGQRKQGLQRLLTHTPDIVKSDNGVLAYYCALVQCLGASVPTQQTEYSVLDSARIWADDVLRSRNVSAERPLVAVHPGASADFRIWPPENFSAVMEHLSTEDGATILLLGGSMDEPILSAIKRQLRVRFVEVDTEGNVGNLAAILQRCALCISHDSGPRHLAIAVGIPSLALFRQHDEILREWSIYDESESIAILRGDTRCPICLPGVCSDKTPVGERFGSHCLRLITVENVIRKAEAMLSLGMQAQHFGKEI
jgi:ADP-heptose:LPS heptosyltransferase